MKKRAGILLLIFCILLTTVSHDPVSAREEKDRDYYETRGDIVWEVPTDSKVIALTFDDGPDSVYTPQIVELLKQYHAKATFFVVGSRVKANPEVARLLAKEEHELANHTYTHPDMRRISSKKLMDEVLKTQQTIYDTTGVRPQLFRPPGGYYSESVVNVAKQAGALVIMWSWHQDTRDWSDPGVNKIVNKVLRNARNGDIVLFHDYGGNRRQTVQALKQILPELQRRGYQFVTVSELMKGYGKIKKVGKGD
ncbi:polysaccharide deacetylase family sporulation protein PdaB [Brevibacillus reuszeri]|uniref:Chitooligosaccharide deacetylase n=1 Tax=Brevibacillus reuszeri TaxID=54915 RepID=A0A0K9YLM4_9BACL|nr:polysaccharide deacetylase family protein [Brevibacillus reuszeri]KNB69633.1 chitooligosaccharide deacetylase [Brevibacillus reuszeri]MED1855990.1 polysaccharide deacetylase family protein [Brevibacillus reuszeri]GED71345.1 polysaccharide deacetylase family sporulation protein PdaB [Brevibacillus reuszeri]